ncbi:putative amino-acid transport system permease abc transporter protein [Marinomonas sp. MED121]|uniref:amino acid ABC transporter permease n=1 Tax=Marinomonas sp. MED121 TaxID=314277 RepID=UPI0000690EC0|nr:amino acid ABC transporter permease [Marinomonas sp. MED121]EAQ64251.1 putative amino-acid transport system permease abc transporter protein [Marinomonas sp. MED121]
MTSKYSFSRLPWWLLAIIVSGILLTWNIAADTGYQKIFNTLSQGIATTVTVTLIAFLIACIIGLIMALAGFSRYRLIREVARFYVEVIRGVPVLVLLFYIAFVGAPELVDFYNWLMQKPIEWQWVDKARTRDFNMVWRAILALCISYSAFIAEVFRAGIQEVDKGQIEAAKALGLSGWQRFRFIIFPQAFRKILPPLGNDFVAMIKDSALVSALGVQDITQLGKVYSSSSFQFFETYNVVAFVYLCLTITLSLLIRGFEQYLNRKQKHEL